MTTSKKKPKTPEVPTISQSFRVKEVTYERLKAAGGRMKLSTQALVSSIFDWYADLDDASQQLITGTLPREFAADVQRRILEKMREGAAAIEADAQDEAKGEGLVAREKGHLSPHGSVRGGNSKRPPEAG